MNCWSLGPIFAFALLSAPAAQQGTETPRANQRAERRAEQMRKNLGSVRAVKSHVRVQVRLKNGNRLRGVVKDGRLVERVTGLRFVDADADDPGAGIRLWYSGGTRNYVFVPFRSLAEYKVLERLTPKQLVEIENRLAREEARRAARHRALLAARRKADEAKRAKEEEEKEAKEKGAKDGKKVAVSPKPAGESQASADAKSREAAELKELFRLFHDYPPTEGWNEARRDEIKRRFVVIGARPSEFEQRFVDKYELWLKACEKFGSLVPPGGSKPGTGKPSGSGVPPGAGPEPGAGQKK